MPALDSLTSIQSPAVRDWIVREGDNVALAFVLKLNSIAVNLTGCTGTCSIRANYDSGSDIVAGTVTFPTPASGTVRIDLTSANTAAIAAAITGADPNQREVSVGFYDVEIQDGTNQLTILAGSVIVSREITP